MIRLIRLLPTDNEYELLYRLVEDDRAAFDVIYRQYYQAVYGNALKITRDITIAEDVLQEVFITLWEKRKTIDINRSVGGWLFVICYNKAINKLRKKLQESLAHQELQRSVVETIATDDSALYELQWEMVESAIFQLSPQKRKVFELCKLQGETYEETAAILHISKYTVKEYLSAAVCFIKDQVKRRPESSMWITINLFLYLLA